MWNSSGAKGSFPNTNLVQWLSPHTPAHFTEGLQLPPDLNSKCLYFYISITAPQFPPGKLHIKHLSQYTLY